MMASSQLDHRRRSQPDRVRKSSTLGEIADDVIELMAGCLLLDYEPAPVACPLLAESGQSDYTRVCPVLE
jgi:hypothetical protein